MTEKILTGNGIRDWDPPETKSLYWAGAYQALAAATSLYGCKTNPIVSLLSRARVEAYDHHWQERRHAGSHALDCDWDRLTPEQRAWYSLGAADALTDVLDTTDRMEEIDYDAPCVRSLGRARQAWIDKKHRIGDDYARKAGVL